MLACKNPCTAWYKNPGHCLTNNVIKTPDTNDDTIAVIVALIPSIVKYSGWNFKITKERKTQFLVLCGFEHMFILEHECVKVFTRMSVNYLYRNLPFTTFALLPLRAYLQQQSIIDKKTRSSTRIDRTDLDEWCKTWHSVQIVAQSADSGRVCGQWHSMQVVVQCADSVRVCRQWHSVQAVVVCR